MSILNAQILTLANPAVWREKLGIDDLLAELQNQITALTDRVAALESALDQAESQITALEDAAASPQIVGGDGITYNLILPLVDGVVTLDWRPA